MAMTRTYLRHDSSPHIKKSTCPTLPNELLHEILSCLSVSTLLITSQVNRQWRQSTFCPQLWNRITLTLSPKYILYEDGSNETTSLPRLRSLKKMKYYLSFIQYANTESGLSDQDLIESFQFTTGLRHIDLSYSFEITDKSIQILIKTCGHQLESLNIMKCRSLTDHSIIMISTLCPVLHSLNISWTNISDVSLSFIIQWIRSQSCSLKELIVQYCHRITHVAFHQLFQVIALQGHFKKIDVSGNYQVRGSMLLNMAEIRSNEYKKKKISGFELPLLRLPSAHQLHVHQWQSSKPLTRMIWKNEETVLNSTLNSNSNRTYLNVIILDCDLIVQAEINEVYQFEGHRLCITSNAKLKDHSREGVQEYLQWLIAVV